MFYFIRVILVIYRLYFIIIIIISSNSIMKMEFYILLIGRIIGKTVTLSRMSLYLHISVLPITLNHTQLVMVPFTKNICLDYRINLKARSWRLKTLLFRVLVACHIKTVPVSHRSRVAAALCSALMYIDAKLEAIYSQTPHGFWNNWSWI